MLTYETDPKAKHIIVRLFRKKIGRIVAVEDGYRYEADKRNFGPVFKTVKAVKRDIEGNDDAQ